MESLLKIKMFSTVHGCAKIEERRVQCARSLIVTRVHAPQSSTDPEQHRPDGGKGLEQHLPMTSTATAGPPQTPQASKGARQHSPSLSSVELPSLPQHLPSPGRMAPRQHIPNASTTPPQGVACGDSWPGSLARSKAQSGPPNPDLHSHCRLDGLH